MEVVSLCPSIHCALYALAWPWKKDKLHHEDRHDTRLVRDLRGSLYVKYGDYLSCIELLVCEVGPALLPAGCDQDWKRIVQPNNSIGGGSL